MINHLYQQPPQSWEAILKQALYEVYLKQLDHLIEQKVRIWESIAENDRFGMSDQENQRTQRRLQFIAEEVQVLDNIRHAIPDLAAMYWKHLQHLQDHCNRLQNCLDSTQQVEEMIIRSLLTQKAA